MSGQQLFHAPRGAGVVLSANGDNGACPSPADSDAATEWFDERAAASECRCRVDRGRAQRNAYIELCRAVEGGRLLTYNPSRHDR
jgi:hypothetical protein